jgi:hypothetical protein
MSFWIVPAMIFLSTPCSSPETMKKARIGSTAPFIVMETDIWSSGMPEKRMFISSMEQTETPALPTSPTTRGLSAS